MRALYEQDEILAEEEKFVLRVEDLVSWVDVNAITNTAAARRPERLYQAPPPPPAVPSSSPASDSDHPRQPTPLHEGNLSLSLFNPQKQMQDNKSELTMRNVGWTERQHRCTNKL